MPSDQAPRHVQIRLQIAADADREITAQTASESGWCGIGQARVRTTRNKWHQGIGDILNCQIHVHDTALDVELLIDRNIQSVEGMDTWVQVNLAFERFLGIPTEPG